MEVLFAVFGCLGAFALGVCLTRVVSKPNTDKSTLDDGLPPSLVRQWQDFLTYNGRCEEGLYDED